ncbi:MAG TPA: aminoglycoside phosphotransferase family protein [Deltaproteobacteria bacterium]|nr:aminoglycoside phosphotransferase family protein [Deltaproteobacteria bacterium]
MMLPALPHPDAYGALRRDPAWLAQVAAWFRLQLGLPDPGVPYPNGSSVVVRYGPVVLKLFCPTDRAHARTEALVLQQLFSALPVETPRLIDLGEVEGWPWVLMSTLPGDDLSQRWAELTPSDRLSLAAELGELLAALHAQRPPGELAIAWPVWSAAQASSAVDQHRRGGCPPPLLEQLPAFLERADLSVGPRGLALLHTEVMREHLKVHRHGDRWRLCGLFDLEPAMVAPVDYEFASVGLFFSSGDRTLLRRVLSSWGVDPLDEALTHRLFALALIHRYANLAFWMRHTRTEGSDLEQLAQRWFGLEPT